MAATASILQFPTLEDDLLDDGWRSTPPERATPSDFGFREKNSTPRVAANPAGARGDLAEPSIAFGPFRLYPRQRLLLDGDMPVRLGSRAFDILIALLERPGDLISKQELIARVWPGINVEDGNLKAHIAALRRHLRDGQIGNRYICTVPGRGYCFVAPVMRSDAARPHDATAHRHDVPEQIPPIAGGDLIAMLAEQLSQQRFVTVVGAGDTGRGLFLAAALAADYRHGVHFVDLTRLDNLPQVLFAVGRAIGVETSSYDPLAGINAFLEDKHMLLVLDNCRQALGAAAAFAASVLVRAPSVQILAMSR